MMRGQHTRTKTHAGPLGGAIGGPPRRRVVTLVAVGILATTLGSVVTSVPVSAATTTTVTLGTSCTLIDAITEADSDTQTDSCVAPTAGTTAWVVQFTAPSTVTLTSATYQGDGADGLPPVTTAITIQGDGSTISRSSATYFRIFDVTDNGDLALDDL